MYEWITTDPDHAYVSRGAEDAPRIRCVTCKAPNPDVRESMLDEPGFVQACSHCWEPLTEATAIPAP